jgi:hypothetical protein
VIDLWSKGESMALFPPNARMIPLKATKPTFDWHIQPGI